ncbi:MAG TPA: hypothetical protein VNK04_14610 [Gemmataceae bacterium]|nr:hypothetical protein [Gemmataceae bacterium]
MPVNEQDRRLAILNTLLTTPHRQLDQVWPVHREMVQQDPRFYVRLAAWYNDHGDVRDHKEMFIIALVLSDFAGHRDVGLALLRGLPPYEVARVVDFISGRKRTRKVRPAGARGRAAEPAPTVVEEFGLFRNLPRALPPGGHPGRCVPVHRRLLRSAEPGAAAGAAVEAGAAHGDHGVPAADAPAGLMPQVCRLRLDARPQAAGGGGAGRRAGGPTAWQPLGVT